MDTTYTNVVDASTSQIASDTKFHVAGLDLYYDKFHALKDINIEEIKKDIPSIDKKDIATLVIFIIVILLWIIPSLFKDISPDFYKLINGTAMPPILGTILLCILRFDNKPIIKIDDAFKNGVPWGSLLMCAATLTLGSVLSDDTIGIKIFLQNSLGNSLINVSPILLLIIFVSWAAIQTNLSSNMVTASLVSAVCATLLRSIATTINLPSIICVIGMMSALAFATPPSMPHIAIISSSGYCETKDTLIYGSILMIISIILSLLIAYPLGTLIL